MNPPLWKFRVMSRGEMNADPIAGEFFSTEHLDSITDALVREVIQNSLDAAIPGNRVLVRFRVVPKRGVSPALFERYFASLSPHLAAEQNGLAFRPHAAEPMPLLVIEDYGTRGLEGDFTIDSDLDQHGKKNDFFYFWRNVGRSGKSEGDRGRWGLGKTVYQAASRINSFLGVTVRSSDHKQLLMGQATLKTHLLDERKYYPYGWYGDFDGDFALPVDDIETVSRFCADFSADRSGKPGLSVVVPYPDPTITALRLISSVLVHYFFPIIGGTLVVEIAQDSRKTTISQDTIDSLLEHLAIEKSRMSKENLHALFQMSRWVHSLSAEDHVLLRQPNPARAAEWKSDLFHDARLASLRTEFEAGQPIAVRVPLRVQKPHHSGRDTFFAVYLQRDETLEVPEDHFVREGITIAGVRSLRTKGIRAIVVADDAVLSTMLGDAENPAHTEWQERSPKFRGKYVRGASCLRFVKNSPREIVRILSASLKGRDEILLRDVFHVGISSQPAGAAQGRKKDKAGEGDVSVAAEKPGYGQGRYLLVAPVKQGFRVSGDKSRPRPTPFFIVQAAYLIRRGDPFARYSPLDFELGKEPIAIRSNNVVVHKIMRNQIHAEATADTFSLEVLGFDPNRDLIVRAELVETGAS
ncbi:MAG TPA: hypothetical protein VLH56_05915 [Dissulfurispiraceae bacterium]|nr:hypothetical protein [Dissulfurispiraceae bacterium]